MSKDPRVDAYIATTAPFARPILESLRSTIREAVPGVEETIKMGRPVFRVPRRALRPRGVQGALCIHRLARARNWQSATSRESKPHGQSERQSLAPKTPSDLAAALKKNKKAHAAFEKFPPSHKREYIEWIAAGKSRNWKYER